MIGRTVVRTSALRIALLTALTTIPLAATTRSLPAPPPPPPGAPAAIEASPGNARIKITWPAVYGASGYRVFRSTTPGVWDPNPVVSVSSTSFTNTNLLNGTKYWYRVAAYNKGGNGAPSASASATPLAPPTELKAAAGDHQVTLSWLASPGASSYVVQRKAPGQTVYSPLASGVNALQYVDAGLTNGSTYYYKVAAVVDGVTSALSASVWAKPVPPPPSTAPVLTAEPGNARVMLSWSVVAGATSYRVYRSTLAIGETPVASTSATSFKDWSVVNGTMYRYRVVPRNMGGDGPSSSVVEATPLAPPVAPTSVAAVASDHQVSLSWAMVPGADGYRVYRGTASNKQGTMPLANAVTALSFADTGLANGPTYYYKVTAYNAGGESPRSLEVSGSPEGPVPVPDPATMAAFRLLRQATWGPKPGEVDAAKVGGVDGFFNDQFAAPVSSYPATLYSQPVEMTQEHFMHLALTGPDQLRQRLAWALHKIWVVSANDVDRADAIATYHQLLLVGAFGNYRALMREVTLNPAMGRYLNMLNNKSQLITGTPPNENYARELMQLFTVGIPKLNPDGSVKKNAQGQDELVYSETDVKELARIFTGWTFGDGNPSTIPTRTGRENWTVPMEAVARYHDSLEKKFLGTTFPAGQSAEQDLNQALDVLFNHANMGPFISAQLIKQLVTSNPSPSYVAAVAAVFNGSGGARGDLAAVVRAVLTHPEAQQSTPGFGKLSEPVLFVVSQLRALNASVTDHPFMSDKVEEMGQKVMYPGSVFSYFSPNYKVRGTGAPPLTGPEFQILTTVTSTVRANFVGELLGGRFGTDVAVDYSPFTSLASDPAQLVDYCNQLFMGGRMSLEERAEIISAVRVSSSSKLRERVNTAIYLTLVAAQGQVDW